MNKDTFNIILPEYIRYKSCEFIYGIKFVNCNSICELQLLYHINSGLLT